MSIKKGAVSVYDKYRGTDIVWKVYKGSNLVFNAASEIEGPPPLTFQSRSSHDLKNYQVYGRTVVNLANAILEHANIAGDGIIMNPGLVDPEEDKYVLYTAPVESGKTYTITTSEYDGAVVYAFYSTQPAYGVQSYDNARTVLQDEHQATVTASITGWIAFRDHITAPAGMIIEGSTPAPIYVPPGTSGGVGEETENLVTETIQGVTINSAGTLVTSSTYNVSIAPITTGTIYTLSRDYNITMGTTHYAFFANLPAKGSTSYDGNRNSTEQVDVTFTAPITGYVAVLNKENKSTVAEGSTAIPYGYKIPLTITNDKPNLVSDIIDNAYVTSSGVFATNSALNAAVTSIEKNKIYTILKARTGGNMFCGFFETYPVMGASTYNSNRLSFGGEYYTFTAPITGYLVSSCSQGYEPIVYEGEYQPRESIETPLYIGDSKLGEDEYVDFETGKVYREANVWNGNIRQGGIAWNGDITSGSTRIYSIITNLTAAEKYTAEIDSDKKITTIYAYNGGTLGTHIGIISQPNISRATFTLPEGADSIGISIGYYSEGDITPSDVTLAKLISPAALTPVDPPIPFPALITFRGANNLSVNTQVQPEKVVLTGKLSTLPVD